MVLFGRSARADAGTDSGMSLDAGVHHDAGHDSGMVAHGPLAISPPSASVNPLGQQMFTASGGSGMGYTWALSTNGSGGNITAAGLYTAGTTSSTTDVVKLTDSASNSVTATVTVGSGVSILPTIVSVPQGGMVTFMVAGGTPPYTWSLSADGSGPSASVSQTGAYTAGSMAGTDMVTVKDSLGSSATATITVTTTTVGLGTSCVTNGDCVIDGGKIGQFCVDAVCCNAACTGQCQACNAYGSVGTCITITGSPVGAGDGGTRMACAQSDPNNICTSLRCDGTSATACGSLVGKETSCGIPLCVDEMGTPGAVCQGDGGCEVVAPKSCAPFGCVADSCATACTDTSECSPGNYCDVSTGKCVAGAPVPDAGMAGGAGPTSSGASTGGCSIGRVSRGLSPLLVAMGLVGLTFFRRRRRG